MLKVTSKKHDLVCIKVSDPKEQQIPKKGIFTLQDTENGTIIDIDFSSKEVQEEYHRNFADHNNYLNDTFKTAKTDVIDISTGEPYIRQLIAFFKARQTKALKHY